MRHTLISKLTATYLAYPLRDARKAPIHHDVDEPKGWPRGRRKGRPGRAAPGGNMNNPD